MAKYRFDEIAFNSTEKKKPVESDKDTYLGLENLDSGCLTVTRIGADVAPIGEKLVMKKGDVLFGKRRAYQKKVAIAPFDGIFSAHGMVLRPKEEVVCKKFFPLFISSDYFLDAAIKISVGSLSPTINWRDLKELEFNLPDLTEQGKLADALWAINGTREAYKKLLFLTDQLVKSQFIEHFGDPELNQLHWNTKPLGEIASLLNGRAYSQEELLSKGKYPVLRVGNFFSNGEWYYSDLELDPDKYCEKGDLLFAWSASFGPQIWMGRKVIFHYHIWKILLSPVIEKEFAFYLLLILAERIKAKGHGVTMIHTTKGDMEKLLIPLPSVELQRRFIRFLRQSDKSKFAVRNVSNLNL